MKIRIGLVVMVTCALAWAALAAIRVGERGAAADRADAPLPSAAALPWPATGQAAVEIDGRGPPAASGGDGPVPIASLAKLMTAYLVLGQDPLRGDADGFTVTISPGDVADYERRAGNDESVVRVAAGEVLDERQLLAALLLPSGNNIAILLAVHEAGTVAAFVVRMNDAARRLGMRHTRYTDPSGLDAGTVSTAPDQLRLVRAALRDATFAAIVRLRSAVLPVAGTVRNTNPLVGEPGFAGVKTGSDDAAGGCLAFAATRQIAGHQVTVVGVVLGQRGPNVLAAAGAAARPLVAAAFARAAAG